MKPATPKPLDPQAPRLSLGAFFDEITDNRTGKHLPVPVEMMFATGRGAGLSRNVPRSANFGTLDEPRVKKLIEADPHELALYLLLQEQFGVRSPMFGSAIGKQRLVVEGPSANGRIWVPPQRYLETEVSQACNVAKALGATTMRIFTFNPPAGANSSDFVTAAIDYLGAVTDFAKTRFGLACSAEIEVHLVGDTASNLLKICQAVPNLSAVWDFGNVSSQGDELFEAFKTLFPVIAHIHGKHYVGPAPEVRGQVVEDHLRRYYPLNKKAHATGVIEIFQYLVRNWETFVANLQARGFTEAMLDLEPHVRGGGIFGGASGLDGLLTALLGLVEVLTQCGIETDLPNSATLDEERGFALIA